MAKEEEGSFGGLVNNWPALTALVVAALSLVLTRTRLDSPRPTAVARETAPRRFDNTVPARLWQDPFSVVPRDAKPGPLEEELDQILDALPKPQGAGSVIKTLFLLAYVDPQSDPDPESQELRRRERYAALSALATAGYVPVSPETLSYIAFARPESEADAANSAKKKPSKIDAASGEGISDAKDGSIVIPYEWFSARVPRHRERVPSGPGSGSGRGTGGGGGGGGGRGTGGGHGAGTGGGTARGYQAVCLLWVTDDVSRAVRLGSVCDLIPRFNDRLNERQKTAALKVDPTYVITGRIGSNRLYELVSSYHDVVAARKVQFDNSRKNQSVTPSQEQGDKVKLFVTQSTVEDVRIALRGKKSWIQPHYVIGTDDELATALVEELKLRGVEPGKDDIAIISEWDTEYGRLMMPTFKDAVWAALHPGESPERQDPFAAGSGQERETLHLTQYSYLRGLDGKLPGDKDTTDDRTGGEGQRPGRMSVDQLTAEKGEGNSEIDYLRRLVDRMTANNKKFRAIGIMGSDVYDKLLLLKALRSGFPNALFFTTDLDVRLLQPGDLPHTHNLIIASHFGLTLSDALQKHNPPFRSGYDTSSYLGYLLAADFFYPGEAESLTVRHWREWRSSATGELPDLQYRKPRVYEVGRSGAYELSYTPDDLFHAPNPRQSAWLSATSNLLLTGAVLVVVGLLLLPVSSRWREFVFFPLDLVFGWLSPRLRFWRRHNGTDEGLFTYRNLLWLCGWLALLLTVGLVMAMHYSHVGAREEPVEWLEGLSVWPTEVLRWLASLLSLFFIAQAYSKLLKRNQDIQEKNQFVDRPAEGSWIRRFTAELHAPWKLWFAWKPSDPVLQEEWNRFRRYGQGWSRLVRCVIVGCLYLLLFAVLDRIFDHPLYQARGPIARNVDHVLRAFSGACQIGLLVFVVDSTMLCYRFIRYLCTTKDIIWPDGLLDAAARERGFYLTGSGAETKKEGLKLWLLIQLIDDATHVVAGLLYKPFIVLLILLVAQSRMFENWHWQGPMILTFLVSAATAFGCAMMLQRAAANARREVLDRMDELITPQVGQADQGIRARLERLREDIENLKSGAFASLQKNPAIRAALIPLGGGGGLAALEALLAYM
jgi:hypothetical protein